MNKHQNYVPLTHVPFKCLVRMYSHLLIQSHLYLKLFTMTIRSFITYGITLIIYIYIYIYTQYGIVKEVEIEYAHPNASINGW